jgi:hypothetical protein
MVFFVVHGVNFDLASFNFQVPISGSAAKQSAPPQRQNANVNPRAFVFMWPSRQDLDEASIFFEANGSCSRR